jgi:hypothetical protein
MSEPLDLILPDWGTLDDVLRSPLPFALWTIGDQCLLHHWLDHAVNIGAPEVRVHAADRPAAVRQLLVESTLWPVEIRFHSLAGGETGPPNARMVDWLPGIDPQAPPPPANGWDLLDRAATMEHAWLDRLAADADFELLSIGSSCRIHPDAKLLPPYSIGDHVLIGPGCQIGPHAVIGSGSVISGANLITKAHLSPHSYLGPVTALEGVRLEHGTLVSLKNRTRLDDIEPHLVASLKKSTPAVPFRERIEALRLYLRLRSSTRPTGNFETFDGLLLAGDPSSGGLQNRVAWLPLVWQGKLRLYGVLPRTKAQLETLEPDWQGALRHAPQGVFSYADCLGCHSPDHPEEALHAIYQTSLPAETLLPRIAAFTRSLRPGDLSRPPA